MRGEEDARDHFGQDEERDEPSPHEEAEVDVVPEGDEGEDDEEVDDAAGLGEEGGTSCSSCGLSAVIIVRAGSAAASSSRSSPDGNVQIPDNPAVEGSVPAAPEGGGGVVV